MLGLENWGTFSEKKDQYLKPKLKKIEATSMQISEGRNQQPYIIQASNLIQLIARVQLIRSEGKEMLVTMWIRKILFGHNFSPLVQFLGIYYNRKIVRKLEV